MKKLTLLFALAVVLASTPSCTSDPPDTPVEEVESPTVDTTKVCVKADSVGSCSDADTTKKQ